MKIVYLIINLLRFGAEYITIKKSLLRSMIFLILLTSGTIMIITTVGGYLAVRELSRSILVDTADRIESELHRFFEPVTRTMEIITSWDRSGLVRIEDSPYMHSLFSPLLIRNRQISSAHAASGGNAEYMLLSTSGRMMTRIVNYSGMGKRAMFTDRENSGQTKVRIEDTNYDLSSRVWHKNALLSPGKLIWSEPYIFFTTKDPGLTVSHAWDAESKRIIALDIELSDLSEFTSSLKVGTNGMAFIFTEDGKTIGLPRHSAYSTRDAIRKAVLSPVTELVSAPAGAAVKVWRAEKSRSGGPFEFSSGGENWWAGIRQFSPGPGYTLNIGVAVPETDFLSNIKRQRIFIVITALIALLISVFMSMALAKSYSGPLEELSEESRKIARFDLSSDKTVSSSIFEVDQLSKVQASLRSAMKSFSRYVPVDVVRELIEQGDVAKIGGKTLKLTVMFSDIKGFTSISEQLDPAALTSHMADYFKLILDILEEDRGTVDKFIGDAVLAFWGAPRIDPDHACNAVSSVIKCRAALKIKSLEWISRGLPAMETRFGLDTGDVVVGNVGAPHRLSYTVLGDRVNQASRLEGLNKLYGTEILVSEEVKALSGGCADWRVIDKVTVKGKAIPVTIYEPLGFAGRTETSILASAAQYEEAFTLYQSKKFSAAAEILDKIRKSDSPSDRLFNICRKYENEGTPEDWDGVTRIDIK